MFKVGELVRVIPDIVVGKSVAVNVVRPMLRYAGKMCKIVSVHNFGKQYIYEISFDGKMSGFTWDDGLLVKNSATLR